MRLSRLLHIGDRTEEQASGGGGWEDLECA